MKKVLVICAAAFIAIGAAVSSSTMANAEDNDGAVLPAIFGLAPVPSSAAPPEKPITIGLITIAAILSPLLSTSLPLLLRT